MDFSKFDNRSRAEKGAPLHLVDPDTREPLTHEGKACIVYVRGAISHAVQSAIRQKLRDQVRLGAGVLNIPEGPARELAEREANIRVMEDVHEDSVEATLPFIRGLGFENISRGDRPLDPSSDDDLRWFLNLTFPVISIEKDAKGNNVLAVFKDEDGKEELRPKVAVMNFPFTKQVQDFAAELGAKLGND